MYGTFSGEESVARDEVRRHVNDLPGRQQGRKGTKDVAYLSDFLFEISENVRAYDNFTSIVLPAIARDPNSSLAVLNQGAETSLAYKRLLAEYLIGAPAGKQLHLRRRAIRNLNKVLGEEEDEYDTDDDDDDAV